MFPQTADSLYELAFRESDGIEVALLWNGVEDRVLLSVRDRRMGEWCVCGVDGGDALEAYRHPFAYMARRDGDAPAQPRPVHGHPGCVDPEHRPAVDQGRPRLQPAGPAVGRE